MPHGEDVGAAVDEGAADLGDEGVRRWVYVGSTPAGSAGAGRCTFVADAPAETSEYVGEGGGKREGVGRQTLSTGGAVVGRWEGDVLLDSAGLEAAAGGSTSALSGEMTYEGALRLEWHAGGGVRGAIRHGVGVGKTAAGKEYEGQWVDGVRTAQGAASARRAAACGTAIGTEASRTGKVSSGAPMASPPPSGSSAGSCAGGARARHERV